MKDSNSNTNYTNIILNLCQDLNKKKAAFTLAEGATHVDLPPTKVKFAFTLAEVLITLGIIGIVAAMTIPTLISKNQKRVIEAKIKEDYSIIQQVIKSNEANDTDMSMIVKDHDIESQKEWFNTYFAPYMKYSQVCYDEKGCWQSKKENLTLIGERPAYDKGIIGLGIGYDIITIRLANGTNLCIDGFEESDYGFFGLNQGDLDFLVIYIDANGDSGPNVIGKDIFILTYTPEYGVLPAGAHKSTSVVNQNCSKDAGEINAGYFCLLKMKDNGWEIPDDVWNKKV